MKHASRVRSGTATIAERQQRHTHTHIVIVNKTLCYRRDHAAALSTLSAVAFLGASPIQIYVRCVSMCAFGHCSGNAIDHAVYALCHYRHRLWPVDRYLSVCTVVRQNHPSHDARSHMYNEQSMQTVVTQLNATHLWHALSQLVFTKRYDASLRPLNDSLIFMHVNGV